MTYSMTGQEKGDRLIEVTVWRGFTVATCVPCYVFNNIDVVF